MESGHIRIRYWDMLGRVHPIGSLDVSGTKSIITVWVEDNNAYNHHCAFPILR